MEVMVCICGGESGEGEFSLDMGRGILSGYLWLFRDMYRRELELTRMSVPPDKCNKWKE